MIHHAQAVAESSHAIRVVVKAEDQLPILQFEEVGGDDADDIKH